MGRDVKTLVNPWWLQLSKGQKLTFFAETQVRDREVGGSNPLAPKKNIKKQPLKDLAAFFISILPSKIFKTKLKCGTSKPLTNQ